MALAAVLVLAAGVARGAESGPNPASESAETESAASEDPAEAAVKLTRDEDAISDVIAQGIEAVTKARHDLKLGFTVGGQVKTVEVEPGERISQGQTLMEIRNEEGKALIEIYEIRADSDVQERSAREQVNLAEVELEMKQYAFERDAASEMEVRRREVQLKVAELELESVRQQMAETKLQLKQAKARGAQYELKAPMDGVVEQVIVSEGETVEALKPVLRMVVTDPLRIDAFVPTQQTLGLAVDGPAYVAVEMPGHRGVYEGKIVHLASVADAASNTRLVRIQIDNRHHMPAGTPVFVSFEAHTAEPVAAAATPR